MKQLNEIISNLRTSIAYSKRPGNEGQMLANGKGIYRPVGEVLQPALDALLSVEDLISNSLIYAHSGTDAKNQVACILAAIESFKADLEPKLNAANAAKAASLRKA